MINLKKYLWIVAGLSLLVGAVAPVEVAHAKSYLTITKTKNTDYNARFFNQKARNDGIYYYGPYYTKHSAKTRDASGKNWQHRFVRVSQTVTLSNGAQFAKFSWYGKTIGWVDVKALQKYSRSQKIATFLNHANFQGSAMVFNNFTKGASHVSVGYANADKKILNSTNSLYPTASLQKVMTGALIEQLAASGKLSMNTKLSAYYPSVRNSNSITIRQLLNHRSGIDMDETTPSKVLSSQNSEINYTLDQMKVAGNNNYNYTNANYVLLAGIASKVTGKDYNTLVSQRIVKPLGLKHTYAWNQLPSNAQVAAGYQYNNGKANQPGAVSTKMMSSLLGAGNYYTTPEDYYAIQKGIRNGKILTKNQYYDLMNDYHYSYAGGLYHLTGSIKRVRGVLSGSGYEAILYGTEGNRQGVVLFANQRPTRSINDLAQNLYDVARYCNEN